MIERYNLEGNIDPNGPLVFYEDYESLAARLADYEDAHRVTVEDCGAPDEQHCSCVPSLRLEMKRLQSRLAEAERDKEHLQRAVDRACQVMREDVLTQDLDGTTTARVNLFLATYGTPVSADAVICVHCGLGAQFDGAWHKPDCPTLNHPVKKISGETSDGDGGSNEPAR